MSLRNLPTEDDGHGVDSRDNPFLPGGNLSKEAEEILSRATIIRDTFILRENEAAAAKKSMKDKTDSAQIESPKGESDVPVTETMTTEVVKNTEASIVPNSETSADTRHKENGQLDTDNSLTPGSVKVDVVDDDKNRKKQKKCCSIM